MNTTKSTFALGHAPKPQKRVSHEEKILHGTRGFCHKPALDAMGAKYRDSAVHCAVIAFATARKHKICGQKKKSLYGGINYMFLQCYQNPDFAASKSAHKDTRMCLCAPAHFVENLVTPGLRQSPDFSIIVSVSPGAPTNTMLKISSLRVSAGHLISPLCQRAPKRCKGWHNMKSKSATHRAASCWQSNKEELSSFAYGLAREDCTHRYPRCSAKI